MAHSSLHMSYYQRGLPGVTKKNPSCGIGGRDGTMVIRSTMSDSHKVPALQRTRYSIIWRECIGVMDVILRKNSAFSVAPLGDC